MRIYPSLNQVFFYLFLPVSFSFINSHAHAQVKIEGVVLQENNSPVPYASIKLLNHQEGIVSDNNGNFQLKVLSIKNSDTLLISSVGYETLKIPLQKAAKKDKYILKAYSQKMEAVIVRSFGKEDIAGAKKDIVGFYRSWNKDNTGGEIGRSVYVPHKEYLISRVRFKVFSTCDTCIIRLHIREMINDNPGRELLQDSVATIFYSANVADKTYDFDLAKYNLILNNENIFVGFEVLKGSSKDKYCSLSFVGSEPGTYIFKSAENGIWSSINDYSIHLKVFFRYD